MFKLSLKNIIVITVFFFAINTTTAQLKVRNDAYIQIGYEDYRTLSFGIENNTPNNGRYAIEHWDNGLNFWKPWPTPNYANYILFLRDDNNVGIGTSGSSVYKLDVAGYSRSYGWYTISDKNLKNNIKPLNNSLNKILNINGVSFDYEFEIDKYSTLSEVNNDEIKSNTINGDSVISFNRVNHRGFIAQNIKDVMPNAVIEDDNGYLNVNYNEIIPLLVEAIKEQQKQIEALSNNINKSKVINNSQNSSNNLFETGSILYNNSPNPFDQLTEISYYTPENVSNISIIIHDMQGTEKKQYNNLQIGNGKIVISGNELIAGLYTYSLVVDGVLIDTKKMLLTKI